MTAPRPVTGSLAARLLSLPIRAYRRVLSPLLPARCRFAPTCSAYAVEALHTHGVLRGSWLTLRRLACCQPFHPGGYDPVPPVRHAGSTSDAGSISPAACLPGTSAVRPESASPGVFS
ncbi:MAG: yidD [Frankiales bacterium]|nr:yidD [Frankiales bacterium]